MRKIRKDKMKDMTGMEHLVETVKRLRAEDGDPWDRKQTHGSLKPEIIEEAAEVICGINIYDSTGSAENLKEELGDLLLQVVMQARIAEEEGLFTLDDVAEREADKMIRRHPHVFAGAPMPEEGLEKAWEEIKKKEKKGREWEESYLPAAMNEAGDLLDKAKKRKGFA